MMMRQDVLVYLAGPITPESGIRAEENVAAALRVYLDCLARGVPAICPQLNGAFPSAWTEIPYELWMQLAERLIDRCTHVLLLPRWASSPGARRERACAEQHGKPILGSLEELDG